MGFMSVHLPSMFPDGPEDKKSENDSDVVKKRKTTAFVVVLSVVFIGTFWSGNPVVDKISHAAIVGFMGARIFVKYL